jgi:hypothetical protein
MVKLNKFNHFDTFLQKTLVALLCDSADADAQRDARYFYLLLLLMVLALLAKY